MTKSQLSEHVEILDLPGLGRILVTGPIRVVVVYDPIDNWDEGTSEWVDCNFLDWDSDRGGSAVSLVGVIDADLEETVVEALTEKGMTVEVMTPVKPFALFDVVQSVWLPAEKDGGSACEMARPTAWLATSTTSRGRTRDGDCLPISNQQGPGARDRATGKNRTRASPWIWSPVDLRSGQL